MLMPYNVDFGAKFFKRNSDILHTDLFKSHSKGIEIMTFQASENIVS